MKAWDFDVQFFLNDQTKGDQGLGESETPSLPIQTVELQFFFLPCLVDFGKDGDPTNLLERSWARVEVSINGQSKNKQVQVSPDSSGKNKALKYLYCLVFW